MTILENEIQRLKAELAVEKECNDTRKKRCEFLERGIAHLKAELAAMREQESIGTLVQYPARIFEFYQNDESPYLDNAIDHQLVYAAPGASPQPSQAREVTKTEDEILRAATIRSGTLIAGGRLAQPSQARELSDEETDAELALRSLASWLGVGGYNAPKVDAKVFEQKIRDGVNMLHEKPQTLQSAIDKWVTDAGNNSVKPVAAINANGATS